MADALRADLEAAYSAAETGTTSEAPPTEAPAPASTEPTTTETPAPESGETTRTAGERSRDEQGRFARAGAKEPPTPGAKPQTPPPESPAEAPPAASPPVEAAPTVKAPQSWKPAAREDWAKVPAAVQAEVQRRETEIARTLQETADVRKNWEQLQQSIEPYRHITNGAPPAAVMHNLLGTAAALRDPLPTNVAAVVAKIVTGFGVDRFGPQFINQLAEALNGSAQPGQQQPMPQQPMQDPRVLVREELKAMQLAALEQQEVAAAAKFAEAHEFYEDVKEDMALMMEAAARRRLALSYEDAYNRAIQLHPEIAGVMKQREAAKAAANARASTQQAKAAASSVKATPAGPARDAGKPASLRSILESEYDAHN